MRHPINGSSRGDGEAILLSSSLTYLREYGGFALCFWRDIPHWSFLYSYDLAGLRMIVT